MKLFRLWCEAGFDPDAYWRQTPRLLQLAIDGFTARAKWEHRDRMSAAWHSAALQRSKKMPPLDKILGDVKPKRAQTSDEMLSVMRSLVTSSGS